MLWETEAASLLRNRLAKEKFLGAVSAGPHWAAVAGSNGSVNPVVAVAAPAAARKASFGLGRTSPRSGILGRGSVDGRWSRASGTGCSISSANADGLCGCR